MRRAERPAMAALLAALAIAAPAAASDPAGGQPAPPVDEVVALPEVAEDAPLTVSLGEPNNGWLIDGVQLQTTARIRARERTSFGTPEVVDGIVAAVDAVHAKFPKRTHKLIVGDLSREGGGKLKPHKSHQSGRDADIGFYYANRRSPGFFKAVTPKTLDVARTWTLISALLDTGDIQYIFIDYRLQKPLHDHARKKAKVSKSRLHRLFSYPRGRQARVGVIRHSKGHDDHMHVRFHARGSVANAVEYVRRHGVDALQPVAVFHTVAQGNTLGGIAKRYKTSVKELRKWNDLDKRALLRIGRKLVVGWRRPAPPVAAAPAP